MSGWMAGFPAPGRGRVPWRSLLFAVALWLRPVAIFAEIEVGFHNHRATRHPLEVLSRDFFCLEVRSPRGIVTLPWPLVSRSI